MPTNYFYQQRLPSPVPGSPQYEELQGLLPNSGQSYQQQQALGNWQPGLQHLPPMPSGPPPRHPNVDRFFKQSAPPSRPQSWRPQGQRPAPATVGQTTTNPALQDRQRGGQSMARPAPQRGGLGIGGLGMESAGPQRQGTGFMSGDVAWTTPQRPSGPSYYEGLMPGSTYSPMEQQRRR